MRVCLLLLLSAFFLLAACGSPDRTDNLAPVDRDEDQYPGNDNEQSDNAIDATAEVGGINSYESLPDGEDEDGEYDNVFRRDKSDADNAVVTDEDLDMPHTSDNEAGAVPSGAGGGIDGDDGIEDRGRDNLEYGSARSTDEVNGAQPGAQGGAVPPGRHRRYARFDRARRHRREGGTQLRP